MHLALLAKKLLVADKPLVVQSMAEVSHRGLEEDLEDLELAESSSASEGEK